MSDGVRNVPRMHETTRTVAEKMRVRTGVRARLIDAPDAARAAMRLPELDEPAALDGEFDYLHLFVTSQAQLVDRFAPLIRHLAPTGRLWVSWPKGGGLGTDLTLPHVIRIGYDAGLVESTCLRIDDTWSGLQFTHPKPGKHYANSHGTLPG